MDDDGYKNNIPKLCKVSNTKALHNFKTYNFKGKNDPYVKDYYQKAQENQQIVNGMKDVPLNAPQSGAEMEQPMNAPTPNDLAKPAK